MATMLAARKLLRRMGKFAHLIRLHPRVLLLPAAKHLLPDATCWMMPATGNPNSACFNTATNCSAENCFRFMANLLQ
jgi:hypothetical protein